MLVTKHAAELCALLVNDLYGELPSRILGALLTKGRSTIAQLGQYISVSPRYLRNGLSVLIQQNLLYHSTESNTRATFYEANVDACYNIARFGKILEVIENRYGTAERDLVQTLMLLGFARVADLSQAFQGRMPKSNGHLNGHPSSNGLIESEIHLTTVLARLVQADIIEVVRPETFRNPRDVYREIKIEMTRAAPGEKTTKIKPEQEDLIAEKYRKFRDEGKSLKRKLDLQYGYNTKRRKLQNGHSRARDDDEVEINPNLVIRLNHDRCTVELRNQRLADYAAEILGEATGQVYRSVLELVSTQIARCRSDGLVEESKAEEQVSVTTIDILQQLDESINISSGIGKAPSDKIDFQSAEKIRPNRYDSDSDSGNSESEVPVKRPAKMTLPSSDESDASDASDADLTHTDAPHTNGNRLTRVKFEDTDAAKGRRVDHVRQHLLLLAESRLRFLRHCGVQGRGQWTVDFDKVMDRVRESELDTYIEQSFGRHGLRLTRILREKGKLDEKMLPAAALMKKSDVQLKMTAMQMAGLVDVQEVPKDNMRLANRTLFFWFFDRERTEARMLDDVYKAMVRCLQTLQVERYKERNILSFVERQDVKGKEEEVMTAEHYNKYNRHLEAQDKLLGQVVRLDDMVAVLRDY